jgi:NADH-quinone oxidoreductase subunit C
MKTTEEIYNSLKENFKESIIELNSSLPVEPFIVVRPQSIDEVSLFLKENEELKFDSLMCLSGVDDANSEKSTNEDGTSRTKGGTLSVVYHLESTELKHKVVLKVSVSKDNPEVKSVAGIWRHADWHEREAYDLLGIMFLNHPDLRRILMPYDWEAGYPLRKDYENPEFYQGMN